jgi:uroporphyrin-3 C-methyltransferase
MQSLSRSRDENLVVDIEAALRMAQQQLSKILRVLSY